MIRASQILFWFSLSIAASIALYHTSDRTRELNRELRMTNAAIEAEQEKIHVLKAEWVYLSNPQCIEAEARKYLTTLRPTAPRQVIDIADLDEAMPTRAEKMAQMAVPATPIASVKTTLAASAAAAPERKPVVAADRRHINDHLVIRHASATVPPVSTKPADKIGALIAELGTHR